MSETNVLPRFVVFQHTVAHHQELLRKKLGELRRIPPLAPFAPEGEVGTWHGVDIACYAGPFRETSLVPILEQSTVEYVFSLGLVGSLSRDLRPGALVTPVASIRGDGLTDYWADAKLPAVANAKALFAVNEAARRWESEIANGIFYTTSTMYREMDFLKKWAELGVIGVQMEMAQHFLLAHLHGKKVAGVYVVSDLPLEGDQIWRTGVPLDRELLSAYECSVNVLLGAIQLLSGSESGCEAA
jgi:hypothetical protein